MQIVTLYRYTRLNGGITVSPIKPDDTNYIELYRLIADEGKVLVKDDVITSCTDVDTTEGWTEIDDPEEPEEEKPEI